MLGLLAALSTPSEAAVQRMAFLVANNEGASNAAPLYFAEDDAIKVGDVLVDVAGYEPQDVHLVLDARKSDMLAEFGDLRDDIADAKAAGDDVVLFFYYSGHADEAGLQLAQTVLGYEQLESLLENSGADVRLAFLDACQSGTATRRKGGTMAPSFVFDVTEHLATEGTVIVTSSSSDEASQESDEIGGSYFTHYLVSGLAGSADEDFDQRVTLSEVYDYVYIQTIIGTAASAIGTQHPTFEWDLSGEGDVVLADLEPAQSALVFPTQLTGTFAVFDVGRSTFVGEVTAGGADRKLAVRPGRYLVQVRRPTHLYVAEVKVPKDGTINLAHATFEPVEYEEDTAKGAVEKKIRKARRPDTSVRLMAGVAAPTSIPVMTEFLPPVPLAGVAYKGSGRRGFWGVDVLAGGGPGQIAVPGASLVPVQVNTYWTSAGLSAGYQSPEWHNLQWSGGVRAEFLVIQRSFPGDSMAPDQSLVTVAPGGVWSAGWHPGRFLLDLEWHSSLVPYKLEEGRNAFGTRQVLLTVGMRW
ncbi:MAG: caspase family protein [Proteobacteria bacterium]|nr:caspase family protein [Pseudomonadota bacterium]MCP4918005.1 caspase family protein [Pseudomonadota bacterium]